VTGTGDAIEVRIGELLAAGDRPGAATAAIQEFGPPVLRYLRSMLRDEDDASDAFSIFAENVWRGRRFFTGEASALAEEIRTRSHVKVERQRQALDKLRESLDAEEVSLLALRIDQRLSWAEIAEVLSADGEPVEPAALMTAEGSGDQIPGS